MNASDLPDETLFEGALKCRTPEERASYLDQACAGQPELRRKVDALLAAHDRAGEFLEAAPAAQATVRMDCAPDETAGTVIGRYKLLQKIGEGGCGVVYMADQAEPVRRRVALKIIKLGMDTKSVIARFEVERQALALMDHSNIAKVFDAGATETGRPYFVMELVRGMKITEYCDEKKLSTRARLDLFIQVCQAIQHAHQKGIIHRDIKPSNILVTINDGVPVPKVIDFGIAKATSGQQLTDKTLFTAFEQFIGTPAYMSPEQAVLTSLDIDTRSDIYALGVLLYEMLTGRTPFDAKELLAIGLDEMRRTIREQEPPRPSTRLSTLPGQELSNTAQRRGLDPPKLVTELRGDLDWIVMKALEKDRARRYETANGLAMDIQRHLNNEPVIARPPSSLYRFQKMVRRNKLSFAAAGAVLLALMSGLALATWALVRERAARQQTRTEAARSETVARFLKEMLNGVEPSVALGRDTRMLRDILDKTAERVGRDLKNEPLVEAELRTTMGQVYFALGAYDKAAAMHRAALAIRQRLLGDEHLDVARSLNGLGVALDYLLKYPEAEPMLRKALAVRRKHLGNDHADVATSLHNLAHVLGDQGKSAEANLLYLEALAMRKRLFGNEHLDVARTLTAIAQRVGLQGKLLEAEASFREALAMRRKLVGDEHIEVCHSIGHLASCLRNLGKLDEAESLFREGLAIQRKLTGEHPGTGYMLTGLGKTLQAQGRLNEAEPPYRESLQMQRKLLGENHYETRGAFDGLVGVLQKQGKFAEVESLFREMLATKRKTLGNEHPTTAWWQYQLGGALYKQGKLAEAEETAREAVNHMRKAAEKGHVGAQNNLAWILATFPIPAMRDGRSAVAFAEQAVAATSRTNFSYMDTLAAAHAEAGDFAKAVSVMREAIALWPGASEAESPTLKLYQSKTPMREP